MPIFQQIGRNLKIIKSITGNMSEHGVRVMSGKVYIFGKELGQNFGEKKSILSQKFHNFDKFSQNLA